MASPRYSSLTSAQTSFEEIDTTYLLESVFDTSGTDWAIIRSSHVSPAT